MTTLLVLIAAVVPFSVTPFIASQLATAPASTMPPWLVPLLPVLALAAQWLFSNAVAALNKVIRKYDTEGTPVSPRLRLVSALLNAMAGNLDKTLEQKAIASGVAAPRPADPAAEVALLAAKVAPEVKP